MKHILSLIAITLLVVTSISLTACGDDEPEVTKRAVPEGVDLGLSVKWASFNVGAPSSSATGGLYGWADSSGLYNKMDGIDIWFQDNVTHCTWNSVHYGGLQPLANITGTDYDIAKFTVGADWRVPTSAEFQELIDQCVWTEVTVDGQNGWNVTGPNGKSIFLPAAGMRDGGIIAVGQNRTAAYWTANLVSKSIQRSQGYDSDVPCAAWCMKVKSGDKPSITHDMRCYLMSVRPVYAK